MRTRLLFALGLSAAGLVLTAGARGGDWPQFRGPNGSAVAADPLPDEWAADKNVAWKVKLSGYGWSCPVVVGNKVFVTTAASDKQQKPTGGFGGFGGKGGFPKGKGGFPRGKGGSPKGKGGFGGFGGFGLQAPPDDVYTWEIHCLSATDGKTLWKKTAAERKPAVATNPTNGYATETPVTDGERVYVYFGGIGTVFCYDLAGTLVWTADVGAHPTQFGHGTGSSPALADGRLFIQCDNEERSALVALDAKTGKELWRTPRRERTSWSSPFVWTHTGRTEVVCVGSTHVRSYDPATGEQLWELAGMTGQIKATPVAAGDVLYVGCGGGFGGFGGFGGRPGSRPGRPAASAGSRPLFAVKAGATGTIALKDGSKSDALAWHLPTAGPETASPLLYDGHLYVLEDRGGLLSCYDAKTGKQVYKERLPGARGFTSSPWAGGGKVYCLDDAGTTHVVKAGPDFEVLGSNRLGEMTWSSPAAADGALFLRTVDHLYCIREKE